MRLVFVDVSEPVEPLHRRRRIRRPGPGTPNFKWDRELQNFSHCQLSITPRTTCSSHVPYCTQLPDSVPRIIIGALSSPLGSSRICSSNMALHREHFHATCLEECLFGANARSRLLWSVLGSICHSCFDIEEILGRFLRRYRPHLRTLVGARSNFDHLLRPQAFLARDIIPS